ncbi:MAG: peptide-methionine (S)-S-oxide reductase, partial [Chitinophagaceae bacterium]
MNYICGCSSAYMKLMLLSLFTLAASNTWNCQLPPRSAAVEQKLTLSPAQTKDMKTDTATFANGCFWCTEAIFQSLKGVQKVTSGYTGGHVVDPT